MIDGGRTKQGCSLSSIRYAPPSARLRIASEQRSSRGTAWLDWIDGRDNVQYDDYMWLKVLQKAVSRAVQGENFFWRDDHIGRFAVVTPFRAYYGREAQLSHLTIAFVTTVLQHIYSRLYTIHQ
jgi:hypothetical protein